MKSLCILLTVMVSLSLASHSNIKTEHEKVNEVIIQMAGGISKLDMAQLRKVFYQGHFID